MSDTPDAPEFKPAAYPYASGGWGSLKAVANILTKEKVALKGSGLLIHQNKPNGYMCVGCSWAKPARPHLAEFCESGVKATAWDVTKKRVTPDFFDVHTISELATWHDRDLEEAGRLTAPLRYDRTQDKYVEVSWQQAFDEIGRELRALDPARVVFYTSGRASLETSYMLQLFARLFGTNNLPDSSNMCHESSSVGLKEAIGVDVGTITLEDFEKTDLMFFFGQNVGTNSPRMLHPLQHARKRGVPIITFNPLREPGLIRFANPQSPAQMLTPATTSISTQYHQVKNGGDSAAIVGICKAVIDADDQARQSGAPRAIDVSFIEQHTSGYDAFADYLRNTAWTDIEAASGLTRDALQAAAAEYMKADAVIAHYGMGLTQHRLGVQNVRLLCNLLFLRGNIGKPGAGPSPVRGHSNVQGQRTVGITEKPELAPLDRLAKQFSFNPPREKGLNTVETFEAMLAGKIDAVLNLGGNLVRSGPDRSRIEPAWRKLRLTVNVATKLNRSHLLPGAISYVLPCLSRIEIDRQASGEQAVSIEDSTACIHGSRGYAQPASDKLRSEPYIVAGIAKATLDPRAGPDWDAWRDNYALVRSEIAQTYPDMFKDFERRMGQPGGFPRPLPARERHFATASGKAEFLVPAALDKDSDMLRREPDALRLMTLRSDNQFNTTIYAHDDRFRGIQGSRMVVLMSPHDIRRRGLRENDRITLQTLADDGVERRLSGLRVHAYDVPPGCIAGYYPECNVLLPLWHHAKQSKVPAAKSIPVRILHDDVPP